LIGHTAEPQSRSDEALRLLASVCTTGNVTALENY
jgi:hypothetical protein